MARGHTSESGRKAADTLKERYSSNYFKSLANRRWGRPERLIRYSVIVGKIPADMIEVEAADEVSASIQGIAEWRRRVQPRVVLVEELDKPSATE